MATWSPSTTCRSPSPRARCSGSWARTAPARPPPCGSCSGCWSRTGARCAGGAGRSTPRPGAASATCPRRHGLYPKMRVRDQLEYFARLHGLPAAEAGIAAGYWIERLGVADRADDRVEALSLGNQQRVQLAAALVHNPEVLVLDEPFSGLDPVGVDVLAEVLAERAADGIPVIFSSHQLELVERLCEAVAIINHGRLVAAGPVEELRHTGGERRWQVEVADASAGWASGLEGVTVLEKHNGRVVLAVEGDE